MVASLASITTSYWGISPTRVTCLIIRVKTSGWKGYSLLKERKPRIIKEKAFLKGPSYGGWFTEAKGTLQLDPGSSPGSHSYFVVWSQVTQSLLFQGKNITTVYKHEKIFPYCSGYWALQVQDDGRLYVLWGQAVGFDLLIDGIFSWCPHMAQVSISPGIIYKDTNSISGCVHYVPFTLCHGLGLTRTLKGHLVKAQSWAQRSKRRVLYSVWIITILT